MLIPIFLHDDDCYVIVTKRSENLSSHKGQMCFPGGKEDFPGEPSHVTATREAREEIGVHPDHVTILGNLPQVISFRGVAVTPVVGLLTDLQGIKLRVNIFEFCLVFVCKNSFCNFIFKEKRKR